MNTLAIFGTSPTGIAALRRQLAGVFDVQFMDIARIHDQQPARYTVLDISLGDPSRLLELKDWLKRKPKDSKIVIVTDRASRLEDARAFAIGATHVLHRPIDAKLLLTRLWGDFATLSHTSQFSVSAQERPGLAAAVDTLQSIFSSACLGGPLDPTIVETAGDAVVDQVEVQGLTAWIDTVRTHHSQTYQHCLLVTGLAAAFGQRLGIAHKDRQRLSVAGMLHDIGKARIPVAILEKPGPLDQHELAIMRKHPQLGLDALETVPGLQAEMIDMVIHHHEYLDGSGYPHGLQGREISDLVRMITIADVFGALIERRSYKPPLSSESAYQILRDMGPKLDSDLVREFRLVSNLDRRS